MTRCLISWICGVGTPEFSDLKVVSWYFWQHSVCKEDYVKSEQNKNWGFHVLSNRIIVTTDHWEWCSLLLCDTLVCSGHSAVWEHQVCQLKLKRLKRFFLFFFIVGLFLTVIVMVSILEFTYLLNGWLLEKRQEGNSMHHNPVSTTSGKG